MAYVKLDQGILLSSIWSESPEVRVVWITLLALADQHGMVAASATGIAKMAGLPLETVCPALDMFQAPDPHSRTPDDDGRRIARVDGGYVLLNYEKYRDAKDIEARREQVREAVAKHREKKRAAGCNHGVITGNHGKPLNSTQLSTYQTDNARAHEEPARPPAVAGDPPERPRVVVVDGLTGKPQGFVASAWIKTREQFEAMCSEAMRLAAQAGQLHDTDPPDEMARAASYPGARLRKVNPATMTHDRLVNTLAALRERCGLARQAQADEPFDAYKRAGLA